MGGSVGAVVWAGFVATILSACVFWLFRSFDLTRFSPTTQLGCIFFREPNVPLTETVGFLLFLAMGVTLVPALVTGLAPLGLAYLHVAEDPGTTYADALRKLFPGTVIRSTGFAGASDLATAQEVVDSGAGDLFAIGRDFLANPDLVERLQAGAPLNEQRTALFYGGGAEGYTDYPRLTA